jgi:hypothetical protein
MSGQSFSVMAAAKKLWPQESEISSKVIVKLRGLQEKTFGEEEPEPRL